MSLAHGVLDICRWQSLNENLICVVFVFDLLFLPCSRLVV